MNGSKLLKCGRWIVGAAVIGGSVTIAANSSSVSSSSSGDGDRWSPTRAFTVPDPSLKWDYNWDKRETAYSKIVDRREALKSGGGGGTIEKDSEDGYQKQKKPKATRYIILVRHGHYSKHDSLESERLLTPMGKEQAKLTGQRLRNSGIHFDSIISSDFNRAMQTAEIINNEIGQEGLEIEIHDPLLEEGRPPNPDPPDSRWSRKFRPDWGYYTDGPRLEAAFRKYFYRADPEQKKDSYEIIVCHGNIIRYFVCRGLQLPADAWCRFRVLHCSVTLITLRPSGRVSVRALGDVGHLPHTMRSNVYVDDKDPIV